MKMLQLQLRLHSPTLPSSSSSSSSIKLFPNHSFSQKSIPFPLLPKRLTLNNQPIKCRHSELFDQKTFDSTTGSGRKKTNEADLFGVSLFNPCRLVVGDLPPRVYVGHSIYKGKTALTVTPRPPEFAPLDSGAFKISREGYVLLQFAPAIGSRQYDWTRKQVFSLSVGEMGSIMSLGARDSCEFFHDPLKGKSDEGKVRKILKVEPLPDGSGHFFNLSVQNKIVNVDESFYIPVTKAELAVLRSIFNFIMPYLLGWHTFANSIKPGDSIGVDNAYTRDYEWSR